MNGLPEPHEVVTQTAGLYRAVIDAWYAVEKELDVEWTAHKPIQGEATYKVFAYRIALAMVERLTAEGWRPPRQRWSLVERVATIAIAAWVFLCVVVGAVTITGWYS